MNSKLLSYPKVFEELLLRCAIQFVTDVTTVSDNILKHNFLFLYESYIVYAKHNNWLSKTSVLKIVIFCVYNAIGTFLDEIFKEKFNIMIKRVLFGKEISEFSKIREF